MISKRGIRSRPFIIRFRSAAHPYATEKLLTDSNILAIFYLINFHER